MLVYISFRSLGSSGSCEALKVGLKQNSVDSITLSSTVQSMCHLRTLLPMLR